MTGDQQKEKRAAHAGRPTKTPSVWMVESSFVLENNKSHYGLPTAIRNVSLPERNGTRLPTVSVPVDSPAAPGANTAEGSNDPIAIALDRIQIAQQSRSTVLDLRGLGLDRVPSELLRLTAIQKLDLGENQLVEVPAALGQLTALRHLHLTNNQLTADTIGGEPLAGAD